MGQDLFLSVVVLWAMLSIGCVWGYLKLVDDYEGDEDV